MNLAEYSSCDGVTLADLVRRREASPKELARLFMEAVEKVNPKINAVIEVYFDRIVGLDDRAVSAGPFAGVPSLRCAKFKEKAAKLVFSESVMSKVIRAISEWRTILFAVLGSITIIILTDLILTFLFGSQIRLSAHSVFGSNDKQTLLSLLFIEGALIFGAGAVCASAMSESKITVSGQGSGSASYKAEKLLSQRQEIRQKEIATGILLILIGGPLLIIPLIFSII